MQRVFLPVSSRMTQDKTLTKGRSDPMQNFRLHFCERGDEAGDLIFCGEFGGVQSADGSGR